MHCGHNKVRPESWNILCVSPLMGNPHNISWWPVYPRGVQFTFCAARQSLIVLVPQKFDGKLIQKWEDFEVKQLSESCERNGKDAKRGSQNEKNRSWKRSDIWLLALEAFFGEPEFRRCLRREKVDLKSKQIGNLKPEGRPASILQAGQAERADRAEALELAKT